MLGLIASMNHPSSDVLCCSIPSPVDPEFLERAKKFFGVGKKSADLVDPYCCISYGGHKVRCKQNIRTCLTFDLALEAHLVRFEPKPSV